MKRKLILLLCTALIFITCRSRNEIPDPIEFSSNPRPVTKPLLLSDPLPLHWDTIGRASIDSTVFYIDFDKKQSTPFTLTGFNPLRESPVITTFDYHTLPTQPIDLNDIPTRSLDMKMEYLNPEIVIPASIKPDQVEHSEIDLNIWQQLSGTAPNTRFTTALLKDRYGFMLQATTNGLYRFDGNKLSTIIPEDMINSMCMDSLGNLWYINMGINSSELVKVDFSNQLVGRAALPLMISYNMKMIVAPDGNIWIPGSENSPPLIINPDAMSLRIPDSNSVFGNSKYYCFAFDDNGRAWLGTSDGIDMLDMGKGLLYHLGKDEGFVEERVFAMIGGKDGDIWASTRNGVLSINIDKGIITRYFFDIEADFVTTMMMFDKTGQLWSATSDGAYILDIENKRIRKIDTKDKVNSNYFMSVYDDGENKIWLSTMSYDASRSVYSIGQYGESVFMTDFSNVTSLVTDSKGNCWLGTDKGLFMINPRLGRYWEITVSDGLAHRDFLNISQQNGRVIINTFGGYNIFNPQDNQLTRITKNEGLYTDTVYNLLIDRQGNKWVSGVTPGLTIYDYMNRWVLHLDALGRIENTIISFTGQIKDDRIFILPAIGSPGIIDMKNNTIQFMKDDKFAKLFPTSCFLLDTHGQAWIGRTSDEIGLYKIDADWKTYSCFDRNDVFFNENIFSILEYKNKYFVATDTKIFILTPPEVAPSRQWESDILQYSDFLVRKQYNFNSNSITLEGKYLCGDKQLAIIQGILPDTSSGKTFITGLKVKENDLHFLDYTLPNEITKGKGKLHTALGFTTKGNVSWDSLEGPYHLPVNLSLSNDQNVIRFRFAALSSGRSDSTKYAYTLEGFDEKWTFTDNMQTETYLNLSPGDYTFKVSSRWKNGKWAAPAALSFTIRPPWYATWWAYVIYSIVALSLLRLYIVFRSKELIRKNKLLEAKVDQRTEELQKSLDKLKNAQKQLIQAEKMASLGELTAGIAHEIQNPLNFVNNFSELNNDMLNELKSERLKPIDERDYALEDELINDVYVNSEKINYHGKRADAIVKGMLQHSRATSGNKELTDINALCDEYLRLAYHGMRAKDKNFNCEMKTEFDPSILKINIVPQNIGRVVLNLINNAFYAVHEKSKGLTSTNETFTPSVVVGTHNLGDKIEIRVADNGDGIPENIKDKIFQPFFTTKPTGQGTGLGLSLSYDIIKAHGGEINVTSLSTHDNSIGNKKNEGTQFIIQLPYA